MRKEGSVMKRFLTFLVTLVIALTATVSAYASSVTPLANNNVDTKVYFSVSSSGQATVNVKCVALSTKFTSATIETKVQKKVGLIWVTVDNGSWTDTTKSKNFSKSHSVQLSSKGTYRAHVKFTVSGTGGSDDEVTSNVEKTY